MCTSLAHHPVSRKRVLGDVETADRRRVGRPETGDGVSSGPRNIWAWRWAFPSTNRGTASTSAIHARTHSNSCRGAALASPAAPSTPPCPRFGRRPRSTLPSASQAHERRGPSLPPPPPLRPSEADKPAPSGRPLPAVVRSRSPPASPPVCPFVFDILSFQKTRLAD